MRDGGLSVVPKAAAAAAAVIKPAFLLLETCSNDDELLPARWAAAALREHNNADSVLPARSRQTDGGGGAPIRREYLRVIMGQDGRISGRGRKRDGGHMKPSGLRVSGLWSWWNSCTQAACVSTPAAPQWWCLCEKSWKFTGEMFL